MKRLFALCIAILLSVTFVVAYERGLSYRYGPEHDPYYDDFYGQYGSYYYTDSQSNYTFTRTRGYYDQYDDPYDGYYDNRYQSYYSDPYYAGSIPDAVYDPVIFGGLGNYYYSGVQVGSGFPVIGSSYYPYGPYYRYSNYGAGIYSYGYGGYGYNDGYCITGCPGWNAPANRIYGVGY